MSEPDELYAVAASPLIPERICRLDLLGTPLIRTSAGDISPAKPLIFAAVLYLGRKRAHSIGRCELGTLLWPDADDAIRGGRVRWLMHRLKQHGLPVRLRSPTISLGFDAVSLDVDDLINARTAVEALGLVRGNVLAGYTPRISDTFSRWVESTREEIQSTVHASLLAWLRNARGLGQWAIVEECAKQLLAGDELQEEASAALAEAARVSRGGASLSRPRRERESREGHSASRIRPLVGREDVFVQLLDHALGTTPTSNLIEIYGPRGNR